MENSAYLEKIRVPRDQRDRLLAVMARYGSNHWWEGQNGFDLTVEDSQAFQLGVNAVMRLSKAEEEIAHVLPQSTGCALAWSPGGERIAVCSGRGGLVHIWQYIVV